MEAGPNLSSVQDPLKAVTVVDHPCGGLSAGAKSPEGVRLTRSMDTRRHSPSPKRGTSKRVMMGIRTRFKSAESCRVSLSTVEPVVLAIITATCAISSDLAGSVKAE